MQPTDSHAVTSPRPSPLPGELEIIRWSEPTVEMNLAVDETLAREAGETGRRVLRLWWGSGTVAVLGAGDKPEQVLNFDECAKRGVGWIKRVTGGGTVLQTPGVFNYSYTAPDPHRFDLERVFEQGARLVVDALDRLGVSAQMRGTSDVAVGDRKISGNAQARKWKAVLLHGTLLVDVDIELMQAVLQHPLKEPDYRRGRPHSEFVTTLGELCICATRAEIEAAFAGAARDVF